MKKFLMIVLGVGLFAHQACAESPRKWLGSISVGPVWENAGQTQTFYLAPDLEKTYVASEETQVLVNGEIFVGFQQSLHKSLQGQLGLAIAMTNNAELTGVIWDDADPSFDNYEYHYNIQHTHLAVQGKLLGELAQGWIPWVSVGLGLAWNNSHDFKNSPLIDEAVSTPNFGSNTETSFTYTVGLGLQKAFTDHWQVGMSYQFADWGKSQLDRAAGQTLSSGLELDHLYTNGVLFNLTYLL